MEMPPDIPPRQLLETMNELGHKFVFSAGWEACCEALVAARDGLVSGHTGQSILPLVDACASFGHCKTSMEKLGVVCTPSRAILFQKAWKACRNSFIINNGLTNDVQTIGDMKAEVVRTREQPKIMQLVPVTKRKAVMPGPIPPSTPAPISDCITVKRNLPVPPRRNEPAVVSSSGTTSEQGHEKTPATSPEPVTPPPRVGKQLARKRPISPVSSVNGVEENSLTFLGMPRDGRRKRRPYLRRPFGNGDDDDE